MRIKPLSLGFGAVVGALLVLASFWFLSPDGRYQETAFVFQHDGLPISGRLIQPLGKQQDPMDCVVLVHGDGAMNYDAHGFFVPHFAFFAQKDMCVLSWDKPGVEGAAGDWLSHSMADRAALVGSAVRALKASPELNVGHVGLMGFSQAGWVMPKVVPVAGQISFYIFVSPAVNWMRQSQYMSALRRNGEKPATEEKRIDEALDQLLLAGAPYDDFVAFAHAEPEVEETWFTKDRWAFVAKNVRADLANDIAQLRDKPVLLLTGALDGQVDAKETMDVFTNMLGDDLRARMFETAGHSMIAVDERRPMNEGDGLWLLVQVMLQGQDAFVPGYWAAIDEFIAAQKFD